jgi:uncharacterized protein
MTAYDFVHLTFLATGGRIEGRTKLQKTVYFFGLLTGQTEELGYGPHYYGPYSSDVAEAASRLVAIGFLDQNAKNFSSIDTNGFEVTRHDYALSDDGRVIAEKKAERNPDFWKCMQGAADRIHAAGDLDYIRLSVAAKTYFILNRAGRPVTPEEISTTAQSLGWNPTPAQVTEAADYLKKLGLVTTG